MAREQHERARPLRALALGLGAIGFGIVLTVFGTASDAHANDGEADDGALFGAVSVAADGVVQGGDSLDEAVAAVVDIAAPAVAPVAETVPPPAVEAATAIVETAVSTTQTVASTVNEVTETAETVVTPVVDAASDLPIVGGAVTVVVGSATDHGALLPDVPDATLGAVLDILDPAAAPSPDPAGGTTAPTSTPPLDGSTRDATTSAVPSFAAPASASPDDGSFSGVRSLAGAVLSSSAQVSDAATTASGGELDTPRNPALPSATTGVCAGIGTGAGPGSAVPALAELGASASPESHRGRPLTPDAALPAPVFDTDISPD